MNLFGQTLAPEQVFGLVFTLMALVLWGMALRNTVHWKRWFRGWEADRKARRDAELAAERRVRGETEPPRGPWG